MAEGDVETRSKRGQWVNRVIGEADLSQSFSSRDEAIDAGRTLADELGTAHTVIDAEPTGVITDGGDEDDEIVVVDDDDDDSARASTTG
jgi:inorganic pyrophosphatase